MNSDELREYVAQGWRLQYRSIGYGTWRLKGNGPQDVRLIGSSMPKQLQQDGKIERRESEGSWQNWRFV